MSRSNILKLCLTTRLCCVDHNEASIYGYDIGAKDQCHMYFNMSKVCNANSFFFFHSSLDQGCSYLTQILLMVCTLHENGCFWLDCQF